MSSTSYRFNRIVCSLVVFALIVSASGFPLAAPRVQAASLAATPAQPVEVVKEAPASSRQESATPATLKVATTAFASPLATPLPVDAGAALPVVAPSADVTPTLRPMPVDGLSLTAVQQTVDRAGGRLESADKRIQLDVPLNLFKGQTRLQITPMKFDGASVPPGTFLRFDLDALDVNTNAALTSFAQPITLTLDMRGLANVPAG